MVLQSKGVCSLDSPAILLFCLPNDAHALVRFGWKQRGTWYYKLKPSQLCRTELGACLTQSNQVKNWFYTVAPCRTNQKLLCTTRYLQHGAARHGTARHGTVQHGAARRGTVQHGTAWHGTVQHGTARLDV